MQKNPKTPMKLKYILLALTAAISVQVRATELINFQFNEGTGGTVTDTASSLVGLLGVQQNPSTDYVQLMATSPSGAPGDGCITNSGGGFLVVDDSNNPILNITNGPITLESWIYIDIFTPAKAAEGIVAYGNSYKMGMKGGKQVFTLFGIVDITNTVAPQIAAGQWVHLAAAWEPGVGVHFYVDGTEYFEANTNLAARPVLHNYLSIASEGFGNNSVAAFDRVRVHKALLTATDIDSVALTPKSLNTNTLVSYDFNEAAFPSTNAIAPARPTMLSSDFLPAVTSPVWTNDTPSGLPGDSALGFITAKPPVYESISVPYGAGVVDLGANNTNYTLQAWVRLPTGPMEERRVIYVTGGTGPRVSLSINANRTLHTTLLGNTDFTTSVVVPNDDRWHHVAAEMEGFARVRFYLDGVLRQTVNRTATGVPNSGGTSGLTIGKESETRYFRGLLDRVIIHNDTLTNATLDYPAIPGLATFNSQAAHPASIVTNLGVTVTFTAAPTSASAATYQWRYRTNLADRTSIALPGETGLTLTLNNITAQHLGYYFLAVTNAVGASESYAARLSLPVNLQAKLFDFEAPNYVSGLLNGQDGWSNDFNDGAVRVLTDTEIADALTASGRTAGQTVHGGTQALLVTGPALATTSIRTITGLETEQNVTLDFWVRALAAAAGNAIGNTFITPESAAGINGRAAGFRIGPALSIDYGLVANAWVPTGLTADPNTWYRITMQLNYGTRTYDFLVDGVKVNANPIPFYHATSDSLRQIRIFRGANQSGMILDDLNVPLPAADLHITGITKNGSDITITWEGGTAPYQLQRRTSLTTGDWENVGGTTGSTQATDTIGDGPMYYRVGSN